MPGTQRSRSALDTSRTQGTYGDVYGSTDWRGRSNRRVTMLPPDYRSSPQLRQHDSALYRTQATAPDGFYNYDNLTVPEEPLIDNHPKLSPDERDNMDFRRKTHFELQAASAIIDVDSSYVPGGQARTKAEQIFRTDRSHSRNGRRAYAEQSGHPYFSTSWDSSLTRKHDLAIVLPPGVAEKIQEKAWKSVERTLRNGKTGFAVQPELVPGCSSTSLNMSNVDSSLTRKFASSFVMQKSKKKRSRSRNLPPLHI